MKFVFILLIVLPQIALAASKAKPRRPHARTASDFAIDSFHNGSQQPGGVISGGCGVYGYPRCGR